MKHDLAISHKVARLIAEAARRNCRKNAGTKDVNRNDVQIEIQLILNAVKKDLKDKGFQIF